MARSADIIAAVDSGLIAAENACLAPDWVLGDMDSLVGEANPACEASPVGEANPQGLHRLEKYPAERVLRYPSDKDYSDTELALDLLGEKGCDEIWLAGGGGGRTDHLLAIYSLFERDFPPAAWFTANEEIFCLREGKTLALSKAPSSRISVFPLGEGPWEAASAGLKWPLQGLPWKRGFYGLSNEAVDGAFEIRSLHGRFLVLIAV